jgi:hypothetical protein
LFLGSVAFVAWTVFLIRLAPGLFKEDTLGSIVFFASRPGLAIVVVTLALGFLLYQAFVKCKVMTIETGEKKYNVRLRELKDQTEVEVLRNFLSTRLAR